MGSEPKGHVLISVKTDKQVVDDDLDFDGLLCSLHKGFPEWDMCLKVEKLDYFHSYTHDNGTGTCQTAILCSIQYHFNSPSACSNEPPPPVDVENMAKEVVDVHFQEKILQKNFTYRRNPNISQLWY